MITNRPELSDEHFEQLLEQAGARITIPPMRDVTSMALDRINALPAAEGATNEPIRPWAVTQNERVWSPEVLPRPVVEQRRSRRKELGLFAGGLAAAAVVTLALLLVFRGYDEGGADDRASAGMTDDESEERIAYVVTHDFDSGDGVGEVVAVDERTGDVTGRFGTGDQPSVVVSPSGEQIYLLETRWPTPRAAEHVLSVIDASTWETLASITIEGRVQYRFSGPPDLVLSPDGTRLFILATDYVVNEEESSAWLPVYSYWLDVYDTTTLDQLIEPQSLMLPGCGGLIRLSETNTDIAVLCFGSRIGYGERPFYLIDPVSLEVRATLPLPEADHGESAGQPRDLVIADDGATAYAVTNDLRIIEVDVGARQKVGTIDSWKRDEETVYRVDSSDDDVLLIGEGPDLDQDESARLRTEYSITRIDLSSMTELPPIELSGRTMFEDGPESDLYVWTWGDLNLELMNPDEGREPLALDLQYPPVDVVRGLVPAASVPEPTVAPNATQPEPAAATPESMPTAANTASVLLFSGDGAGTSNIRPVDPATGEPLPGYEPINATNSGADSISSQIYSGARSILAAIESKGGAIYEPSGGGSGRRASADVLHLVDMMNWTDHTAKLPGDSWSGSITFSPRGDQVALVLNNANDSKLLIFDATSAELLVERTLGFRPSLVGYTRDGSAVVVFGQPRSEYPGIERPDPPQVAILDAPTLDPIWEQTLPDILSGSWCVQDCANWYYTDNDSRFVSWTPGVALHPDDDLLYISHADADRLTTVDLSAQSVETREIQKPEALLDRFLGLFWSEVSVKGRVPGASKDVLFSGDGSLLYILGTSRDESSGPNDVDHSLQVVSLADAVEVTSRELENGESIEWAPDDRYLMVSWWGEDPSAQSTGQWWTSVLDAQEYEVVRRIEAWEVTVSRNLNGDVVFLAEQHDPQDETTQLAVLDPETFEITSSWTVEGYASWVGVPEP